MLKMTSKVKMTSKEREALIKVRNGLADGSLVHNNPYSEKGQESAFDLGVCCDHNECGTVACIGGWMWIKMHERKIEMVKGENGEYIYNLTTDQVYTASDYVEGHEGLYELFYPPQHFDYHDITPTQAVAAIDNVLNGETSDPDWETILKK